VFNGSEEGSVTTFRDIIMDLADGKMGTVSHEGYHNPGALNAKIKHFNPREEV